MTKYFERMRKPFVTNGAKNSAALFVKPTLPPFSWSSITQSVSRTIQEISFFFNKFVCQCFQVLSQPCLKRGLKICFEDQIALSSSSVIVLLSTTSPFPPHCNIEDTDQAIQCTFFKMRPQKITAVIVFLSITSTFPSFPCGTALILSARTQTLIAGATTGP